MGYRSIQVPEIFKYVLDRGDFEYGRSMTNLSFMIDKHINDSDASFMDDPIYERLKDRALKMHIQRDEYLRGVIYNLFEDGKEPREYWCEDDNTVIAFKP